MTRQDVNGLLQRINELEEILVEIGEFAHAKSTGPAIPDEYWSIRDMAFRAFETSEQTKARIDLEVRAEL